MVERRKEGVIEISDLETSSSESLRLTTLDLVTTMGVKDNTYNSLLLLAVGINVRKFSGIVSIEIGDKKKEISFLAFTTRKDEVIIDANQLKNEQRVRLVLPDWRPPYFIYPDLGPWMERKAPTRGDIEFYSKVIEAAKNI